MIKGKAKMEFGNGDIRMTALCSHGTGALCCITQEPHVIGEKIPIFDTWSTKDAEVIMTFTKTESIDALIAELKDVKLFMQGEFPKLDIEKSDTPLDFDSFMEEELVYEPYY